VALCAFSGFCLPVAIYRDQRKLSVSLCVKVRAASPDDIATIQENVLKVLQQVLYMARKLWVV
jgi:hypothetical protein